MVAGDDLVCVTAISAILLFILWFDPDYSGDFVLRLLGVLGIAAAALTLLTPVLHKLSHKDVANEIDAEIGMLQRRIEELQRRKRELGEA